MTTHAKSPVALARRIVARAHLTGQFTLRSGATSDSYFDKYAFESDPRLLREIAEALALLLPDQADALAGLELGGVPLATVLSQVCGLPTVFVRKHAKIYGTRRLAEGIDIAGKRLVIVEDVITTAGQVIESTRELRELGAHIKTVLCVIDREAGAADRLAKQGLQLRSLFTIGELSAATSR